VLTIVAEDNARMKIKTLTSLTLIAICFVAGFSFAPGLMSGDAAQPTPPADQIRANIVAMLQRKAPIRVLPDIPGGTRTATNKDAAYFAWQEFIALSWPNVPVTGKATVTGPGAREFPDASRQFGQPALGSSVSYPALVWESTRHRSEIYTGTSTPPNGYQNNASASWGYNSTPGYVYPDVGTISQSTTPSDCKTIQPGLTPYINLDEGSQIGVCKMYTGVPYSNANPKNAVLFLAKGNLREYGYIASRGWYNTSVLKSPSSPGSPTNPVASFGNTSGYIQTKGQLPPPGVFDGTKSTGNYVSFPNGTLEFKAAFRVATAAERQAFENGQPIPGGYHVAPIRYYVETGNNTYQYVDTCGVLLSLHIIHKTPTAPYFIFATFEHKDDVIGTDGKPVEDADGNLNPNAFTTAQPTPVPSPYVYPSSGTAPSGQYLVPATSPNVIEAPSQFSSNSVTVQNFIPSPSTNGIAISANQSSYQNTRDGSTSTLPAANSPSATDSYIAVNRRRFSIPQNPIIQVNQDVHKLIAAYGYNNTNNVWLNYKLVNVQWVPAGNAVEKTPGKLYGDTSGGAKPTISVESFYLANSLVETNMVLSAFSGQFGPFVSGTYDGLSITDFYYNPTTYTNNNIYVNGKPQTVTRNVGDPFYNIFVTGGPFNMGGCMGCHGNATVAGTDSSFILKGAPFKIEGIEPSAQTMLLRHQSYFRKN
jgi:hypothetical protein